MHGRTSKPSQRFFYGLAVGAIAAALSLPVAAAAAQKVGITSALWTAEKSELRVDGTSSVADGVVIVRDSQTRKVVGSAAVRADGKWILKVRDPNFVPKRMVAECEGAKHECAVETVAAATDAGVPATAAR